MVNWDGERTHLAIMLPIRMEAGYALRRNLDVGLRMRVDGGQFALDADEYAGDDPQLHFVDVMAGPYLDWRPTDRLGLELSGASPRTGNSG